MHVPFVDLTTKNHLVSHRIEKAIQNVIKRGWYIGGPEVDSFEKKFAQFIGAKYAISVNSGTDALILGTRALGFHPEDEIIVPANTFYATALAATANNLKPVFVDADLNDHGIDLTDLSRKITAKTKAIIPVHLFGRPDKLKEIQKIINQSGRPIALIEDAAQAHGAYYGTRRVGNIGVFGAFSFYPTKNLGAYGDAGMITTNSGTLARRIRLLKEYGQQKKYQHIVLGQNSRLDALQAAVLLAKLPHLDRWNNKRKTHAGLYSKLLKNITQIETPPHIKGRESVNHLYVIKTPRRDALLRYLAKHNIGSQIHYPIPLHMQKAFAHLNYTADSMPNAQALSRSILSLPMYPELDRTQIEYVTETIRRFYM